MIYQPAERFRWARPWRTPRPEVLGAVALFLAGLLVLGLFAIGLGPTATILAGLVLGLVLAVTHPVATAIFMVAFVSVNRFLIMLAYHYTGSVALTKSLELWKEAVLTALVLRVIYDLAFSPDRTHTVKVLDFLVLLFIAISAIYVMYPGPLNVDLFTRLQGFRTDTVFMFAYWAGRGLHVRRRELRWLMLALVPGSMLVAVVALWEMVAPLASNQVFNDLGYADFSELQGAGDTMAIRARDLPGGFLPRASSLQLSDLALAFYQLVLVAMASSLFALSKQGLQRLASGVFLIAMFVTLLLTATRSAIATGTGAMAAVAIVARTLPRFLVTTTIVAAAVGLVVGYGLLSPDSIKSLANFQDPSSQQHGVSIDQSVEAVKLNPFGRGLGTAGAVSQIQLKGSSEQITNESWYLQLATEMGVLGMAAYLAVLGVVLGVALWHFVHVEDFWLRVLTLTVATSAGAMLVSGNFLHTWENTPLSMVFWLFAGIASRAGDLQRWPGYLERA